MTRIAPLLIACGLLAGCTTVPAANQPSASTIADGSDVQLGIGETARLADGSRLSYLRLVNDSRCPPGVQCVWAGDAEIALRAVFEMAKRDRLIEFDPTDGVANLSHQAPEPDPLQERIDQIIFSTSSSIEEATAELPMLLLIFTRKFRPMIMGSDSG